MDKFKLVGIYGISNTMALEIYNRNDEWGVRPNTENIGIEWCETTPDGNFIHWGGIYIPFDEIMRI